MAKPNAVATKRKPTRTANLDYLARMQQTMTWRRPEPDEPTVEVAVEPTPEPASEPTPEPTPAPEPVAKPATPSVQREPLRRRDPVADLNEICALLTTLGEPAGKMRALKAAVARVEKTPREELERRDREHTLTDLAGIGESCARVISSSLAGLEPLWLRQLRARAPQTLFHVVAEDPKPEQVPTAIAERLRITTRTCNDCGAKRPWDQVVPSPSLCQPCWSRRNGNPTPAPVTNPMVLARKAIEDAYQAVKYGRYSAAESLLAAARLQLAVTPAPTTAPTTVPEASA